MDWSAWGKAAARRPWRVIALWAVLLALGAGLARDLPRLLYGSVGVLAGSRAAHAEEVLAREFDSPYAQFVILTLTCERAGADSPDAARDRVHEAVLKQRYVTGATVVPEEDPDRAALLIGLRATALKESEQYVAPLRAAIGVSVPAWSNVKPRLTGQGPLSLDIVKLASRAAGETEQKVLPLTFLALVLSFGSFGASLLPLLAGVAAVVVSLGVLALLAHHLTITVYANNIITMLGLGLGIDYALFVVSRIREEGRRGLAHAEAVAAAVAHAAPAIALSAGTVFLGLIGLATTPARESSGMGIGGMVVSAVSALVALSLMPALAAAAGRWLDAPRGLSTRLGGEAGARRWTRLAELVLRRPVAALVLSLAILVPLALPVRGLAVGDPDPALLPDVLESVQGIAEMRRFGQGGALMPFRLVVMAHDGPALTPTRIAALARLAGDLEADRRVERVFALATPARAKRLALGVTLRGEPAVRAALPREARELVSRDGRAVAVTFVLGADQGLADARALATELLARDWDARYPGLDAEVLVGGNAVMSQEFVDSAHRTYPRVFAIVALVTLLMLLGMTRSLPIALKAVFANTITVAAALGATSWLVRDPGASHLLGLPMPVESIPAGIPLIAFCVVFGLSMDYEVFLLSRVLEAHREGLDDRAAVVRGLGASGGVITSAAAIMGIVFLGFALTPFLPIKLLGLALVLGVVLDATVVRLLLVPSLMVLLGRWNWWPGERAPRGPRRASP